MNIRELIVPLSLAFLITMGIQYFFFNKKELPDAGQPVVAGQSFEAPETPQASRPLNREVDFVDVKRPAPTVITRVETDGATLEFSTEAASLDRITYKRTMDGKQQTITTVFPVQETERERRCFLVALDCPTPYYFTLVDHTQLEGSTKLVYKARFAGGELEKSFVVYHDSYRIDMNLAFTALDQAVTPRLFFISPFISDFAGNDAVSLLIGNMAGTISKKAIGSVGEREGWQTPTLFGAEDRYFINALIADDHFTQRAYINKIDAGRTICIVEGERVDQSTSWSLSFYFGPKEEAALVAVDKRLEQTLEYSGWLAPLSKLFMYLLHYFYGYCHNYGIAIILLTILLRILMIPLTMRFQKSMKKQEDVSKKLKYIEQKHKGDSETINREKARLIKEHGLPGLTGCLPMLLQIPVFFALRNVLQSSIELYHAPFGLWIQDLSMPDPYYILPALFGLSFFMNLATADKNSWIAMAASGIFLTWVMTNLSAGLVLYMALSTFLGSAQTIFQKKVW